MDTLTFFWKYPNLITLMENIYLHMKQRNFDYPFVICGDAGRGKTMFMFHFYELWYRVILKCKVTEDHIRNINGNRMDWLKNFQNIQAYEINANDEAADGISSKEAVKRFGRDVEKLYKINRKKKFISPLIVLDWFDLPPFFRNRVRGLFYIDKQGTYKYYSKEGLKYLNAYNSNRKVKSMELARPLFTGVFPDYLGTMRDIYESKADENCDNILQEIIRDNEPNAKGSMKDVKTKKILELKEKGKTYDEISQQLKMSKSTVSKYMKEHIGKI
jgi:hypothetical protein